MRHVVFLALFGFLAAVPVVAADRLNSSAQPEIIHDERPRLYAVIFGITVGPDRTVSRVRLAKVIDALSGSTAAVEIPIPADYQRAAEMKLRHHGYEPKLQDGKPVEFFTYFYYDPARPNDVIDHIPGR